MKLQTLILCGALLAGCSSPARRPITEEIPLDAMNQLLKDKPDYAAVVILAEMFRNGASTLDLAHANDLTYEALYEFYKDYTDEDLNNQLAIQGEQEWDKQFGVAYGRTDSLIGYWQQYLDENKPDSYVNVELTSIDPEQSTYGTAQVVLRITPVKGPLDKVEGSFGIFPRDKNHSFGDFSSARHNSFGFEQGLRTAETCQRWMNYSIWEITDGDIPYSMYPDRPGLSLKALLEKYCFDYTITTLVKNGKQIRFIDIYDQIPYSVRSYWDNQDKEQSNELYRGNIVRELIDPAFTDFSDYIYKYKQDYFRSQNELAAWVVIDKL